MPTRNVVLTEHQARLVEKLVSSGRYQNASEVLRDGLRLIEAREAEQRARVAALRSAVAVGIEDIASGRARTLASAGAVDEHLERLSHEALGRRR